MFCANARTWPGHLNAFVLFVALLVGYHGPTSAEDLYAPRTDWSSFSGGKLNISGFIYRDLNRNGIYDLEDPPIEGVAVKMTNAYGREVIKWTNSNGFANFSMSARESSADIANAGTYNFEVMIPRGWETTTPGMVNQVKTFEVFPGAVADMIATVPFVAVGLAPKLQISGSVSLEETKDFTVFATSPSGTKGEVTVDSDGQFTIPASPGNWTIAFERAEPHLALERYVQIETVPVQLSDISAEPKDPPLAGAAVVVDFESVTQNPIREIPSGVGGLTWWNFVCLRRSPAYSNGLVSGNYVAYNSSGHPGRISDDKPFDFVGGYFSVSWKHANGETLNLWAWKDGILKYSDKVTLSNLGPIWFQADYQDIDRLDIYTTHYWQLVMDDLAFRTSP